MTTKLCFDSDDNGNTFQHLKSNQTIQHLKSNQTISASQALTGISEIIVHEFIVFDSHKVWIPFKSQNLNRFKELNVVNDKFIVKSREEIILLAMFYFSNQLFSGCLLLE